MCVCEYVSERERESVCVCEWVSYRMDKKEGISLKCFPLTKITKGKKVSWDSNLLHRGVSVKPTN